MRHPDRQESLVSTPRYIPGFLVKECREAMALGRGTDLGLTTVRMLGGTVIFHERYLQIAHEFCMQYADLIGFVGSSESDSRNFMEQYFRAYFQGFVCEQKWSRDVLIAALTAVKEKKDISDEDASIIEAFVQYKDQQLSTKNIFVCLPSIYDDPELFSQLGVSVEEWQQSCAPYLKKNSGGLVVASALYPTDIHGGVSVNSVKGIKVGHDSLTYDLYRAVTSGLSFMDAARISGIHEGHHSYLEQVLSKVVFGDIPITKSATFIHEAFACFREGIGKERRRIDFSYSDMMDWLRDDELITPDIQGLLFYTAGPKFLASIHQLVQERAEGSLDDFESRYIHLQEKALISALKIRASKIDGANRVYAFLKQWMSELALDEQEVMQRFSTI